MYSTIISVQLVAALLKEYEIRDVVMSPGGSDIPILHTIETDPYFTCYSVVDERSAVYFAMGVAQQKKRPVACVCTSGTAVSNYLPGMTEAFYQDVPVVAITADKDPYRLNQLMLQKTEQMSMFDSVTKISVNLPVVTDGRSRVYCERLINDALSALNHHGTGPVHINIPIVENPAIYNEGSAPKARKITRYTLSDDCTPFVEQLAAAKKILVIAGQNHYFTDGSVQDVEAFFDRYNCAISVEHMANLKCRGCLITYPLSETYLQGMFEELCPDLVISFGNNIASNKLKPMIKAHKERFVHWQIDEAGRIRDFSDRLTSVFECTPNEFFTYFAAHAPAGASNDLSYYNLWKDHLAQLNFSDGVYSNLLVAEKLAKAIPDRSVLHLAILNSTRTMQFFDLKPSVRVYSNIGALGIDGCLSSFMGQAASTDALAFCVLGDLSFFYDMNAAALLSGAGSNVRILLLNNGGGGEFHFFMGKRKIPTINQHISAAHDKQAGGWIQSLGYNYVAVHNEQELDALMKRLPEPSDKPIFAEIFADMEKDAEHINQLFNENRLVFGGMKMKLMNKAKSVLKPEQIEKAKKLLKK